MVQWPSFDFRLCRRSNSLQRPVNLQSADPFWIRNAETLYKIKVLPARCRLRSEPSWQRVKLRLAAATCRAGKWKCPHLLWSRSYLAARQVRKCQQLLELVSLLGGLHLELTSAAHITRSGNYLLSSQRLWAHKGTSGPVMKREILYKCFSVSSLVSKEQYSALHEVVICAFETTICEVLCKYVATLNTLLSN